MAMKLLKTYGMMSLQTSSRIIECFGHLPTVSGAKLQNIGDAGVYL
jgi:hypothetical protein